MTALEGVSRSDAWFFAAAARQTLHSGGDSEELWVGYVVCCRHPEGVSQEAPRHHRQEGRKGQGHRRKGLNLEYPAKESFKS